MPTKKTKKKAVAKRSKGELTKSINMAADAGMGSEGADKDSYAIPFLQVLQALSPQVVDEVKGAKPGMFINSITNELFDEIRVIPCAYKRSFIRWADREDGGGFKGQYNPIEVETGDIKGLERTDDGKLMIGIDELKDTRSHFILIQSSNDAWQPAVLSLSKTQIKKSKRWMSLIQGIELSEGQGTYNPPAFSHSYLLTTIKEKNDMGSWFGIEIVIDQPVTDNALYQKARQCCIQANEGALQTAEPQSDSPEDEDF